MVDAGQARRVSKRKAPQAVFQLAWYPDPSSSPVSKPNLTPADMQVLSEIEPFFVERLNVAKVAELSPSKLRILQRLAGHGLLPRNPRLRMPAKALNGSGSV